jgi:hypothetical protein
MMARKKRLKRTVDLEHYPKALKTPLTAFFEAVDKLEAQPGPIVRKRARSAALAALARVRRQTNELYPVQRRSSKKRPSTDITAQKRRLLKQNWEHISTRDVLGRIAAVGIRVRAFKLSTTEVFYAPGWAIKIATRRPKALRRAKTNLRERKAILTELALEEKGSRHAGK